MMSQNDGDLLYDLSKCLAKLSSKAGRWRTIPALSPNDPVINEDTVSLAETLETEIHDRYWRAWKLAREVAARKWRRLAAAIYEELVAFTYCAPFMGGHLGETGEYAYDQVKGVWLIRNGLRKADRTCSKRLLRLSWRIEGRVHALSPEKRRSAPSPPDTAGDSPREVANKWLVSQWEGGASLNEIRNKFSKKKWGTDYNSGNGIVARLDAAYKEQGKIRPKRRQGRRTKAR
jgi:hypothetical protein